MGAVSRDIDKRTRLYNEKYPYEAEGIAQLMRDYWDLRANQSIDGDVDASALLIDLERALKRCNLTPRMKQCLALHFFADFSKADAARVLSIREEAVGKLIRAALDRLEAFMEFGYNKAMDARTDGIIEQQTKLHEWVNEIAQGITPVYSKPRGITEWLASKGDAKALVVLNQRKVPFIYVDNYEGREEYPPYTAEQFRWADRRVSYAPEVYPPDNVAGTRKVVVKLRDDKFGRDYAVEKRKIFARGAYN